MLAGQTVLVVETEYIIALGIQAVLESHGATRVVLASNARHAQTRIDEWDHAGLAIVELEAASPELIELARRVSQSGIPVIGISADIRLSAGVPELPGTPILIKPVPDEDLTHAIAQRLDQNPLPDVT